MSFGLARGREGGLSAEGIGLTPAELPPLPDAILTDRLAGRLDPRAWFVDPAAPFEIEIGCGKGTFLVNQAPASPGTNYLGIEWEYEFYLYTADRLRRRGVTNVRMLHANAVDFLKWRVPDCVVSVIHLYYSDPWPKTKHHKNRVVQDAFLAEVHRVLKPDGELRIVTDHDDYWVWMEEHFALAAAMFERREFTPPEWVGDGELVGTNYERKMRREDQAPHACVLKRR